MPDLDYTDMNEAVKHMYSHAIQPTGVYTTELVQDSTIDIHKMLMDQLILNIGLSNIEHARLEYNIKIDGTHDWEGLLIETEDN